MDESTNYTHAKWHVKAGREDDFVRAWRELADFFLGLDQPPLWGTLLRSELDQSVFYSFGPWPSADAVAAMRANPQAQSKLARVADLCESSSPGPYRLVAHIEGPASS